MKTKMNFRIITKNNATNSKIGSPLKIDFIAVETHESHLTARELKQEYLHFMAIDLFKLRIIHRFLFS